ncbi:MAG: hypothetical protein M1135_00725 [Candidatus Omnitrophica bacterium]|nr:hypothetical protein [Candidatus Omnitrophota bacterium]
MKTDYKDDINNLLDFDIEKRKNSLKRILEKIKKDELKEQNSMEKLLNLHIHSFHSFNYLNWSPSRIILEGFLRKVKYVGIVDFDTIEAVEETGFASDQCGVDSINGFETRVFIKEWEDKVINSPGEPGIYYFCGIGFKKNSKSRFFLELNKVSKKRNRKVIDNLNGFFPDITIDYEKDVIPLTPSGNPTERHIVLAFYKKSEETFKEKNMDFWSKTLDLPSGLILKMKEEDIREKIRIKLIKSGGPGYVFPEKGSFPLIEDVIKNTRDEGGIPVGTWLDGTNEGEGNPYEHIEFLIEKGIKAITIIPERNWNVKNQDEKKIKMENLKKFIDACKNKKIPVVAGTEMNKAGQPFIDDFTQPVLKENLQYFLKSAKTLIFP